MKKKTNRTQEAYLLLSKEGTSLADIARAGIKLDCNQYGSYFFRFNGAFIGGVPHWVNELVSAARAKGHKEARMAIQHAIGIIPD